MKNKTQLKTFLLVLAGWMLLLSWWMISGANVYAEDAGQEASGNDTPPVCTCEEKCIAYEYDRNCAVCAADYKLCAYQKPNVVISINNQSGWQRERAVVTFAVSDAAHTGNFELVKLQAKIGQNGSWIDVTEEKKLEISENCTVYVQAADQKGHTYEKNRAIRCFDTAKPTLNAAVNDGLLSIQAMDQDSGTKYVYVNGYEFGNLTEGILNIRLQQFDTGYEYFTITAMDHAGNMSEVYRVKNPYYKTDTEESGKDKEAQLPKSAEATKPGSASAAVTEHTKTDSEGNAIPKNDETESKEGGKQGKEFYTIKTASEKVFYLIVDRDGEEETVYFLTEIAENDLLNTVSEKSETLPKNSAALESAIPTQGKAPSDNPETAKEKKDAEKEEQAEEEEKAADAAEESAPEKEGGKQAGKEETPFVFYALTGTVAAAAAFGIIRFRAARRKKEDFLDEEDEEEEEYGEGYPDEEDKGESDEYGEFFEELGDAGDTGETKETEETGDVPD